MERDQTKWQTLMGMTYILSMAAVFVMKSECSKCTWNNEEKRGHENQEGCIDEILQDSRVPVFLHGIESQVLTKRDVSRNEILSAERVRLTGLYM